MANLKELRDFYYDGPAMVFTRRFLSDRGYCCESKCRHCPWYFGRPQPEMSVVSLVPSWTETFLAAGIDVRGRTRFCIHPEDEVSRVPVVGGTKGWNVEQLPDADFLVLDKEENTKEMAEISSLPLLVSHIESMEDLDQAFRKFSEVLKNSQLAEMAERWERVQAKLGAEDWQQYPIWDWIREPLSEKDQKAIYVIWKKPWMCVSEQTFIGSLLRKIGIPMVEFDAKYPEIDLEKYDTEEHIIFFSTEPFPFKKPEIQLKQASAAIVDGELFSWFGVRALSQWEHLIAGQDLTS